MKTMPVRTMYAKGLFGLLATAAIALTLLPFAALPAYAAEIESISGSIDADWKATAVVEQPTIEQAITLESGYVLQTESGWYKKSGEGWSAATSTFDVGIFRYHAVIRIADVNNKYAEDATLVLGDEAWTLVSQEQVADGR